MVLYLCYETVKMDLRMNPGFGVHDVAISRYVFHRAQELGLGTELPT